MDDHSSLAFIKLALLFIFMFFAASGFKRFGIPTIISFLFVGFLAKIFLGDEDVHYIVFFKELGIILLFFFIGLEYTFERLRNMFFIWKPGIVDFVLNFIPAFLLGLLFGLSPITSLILASVFYPTSTSIIAKLLTDFKRLALPEAELLIGILIFEDLVAIIILSLLIPLKEIGGLQFEMFFPILLKLLIVLVVFYILYRFVLPRLNFWMNAISEDESFSFFIIGFVMLIGFLFKEFGISEALGAFLLGVLVPETRIKENIERQFFSLKELSVGVFFFFFAYEIPLSIPKNPIFVILLTLFGIISKIVSTYISAYFYGMKKKARLRTSLSFVPRGEFSVILSSFDPTVKMLSIPFIFGTALVGAFLFALAPRLANIIYPKSKKV